MNVIWEGTWSLLTRSRLRNLFLPAMMVGAVPVSPVHIPLEHFTLARWQQINVADQEPVVFDVEQHFAPRAEVLHLALGRAHREAGGALLGAHVKIQIAAVEVDPVDAGDPAQEVAALRVLRARVSGCLQTTSRDPG